MYRYRLRVDMSSDEGVPYVIRHDADQGDDEWVSPEPADEVITDAVVESGAVESDDVVSPFDVRDEGLRRAVGMGPVIERRGKPRGHEAQHGGLGALLVRLHPHDGDENGPDGPGDPPPDVRGDR